MNRVLVLTPVLAVSCLLLASSSPEERDITDPKSITSKMKELAFLRTFFTFFGVLLLAFVEATLPSPKIPKLSTTAASKSKVTFAKLPPMRLGNRKSI